MNLSKSKIDLSEEPVDYNIQTTAKYLVSLTACFVAGNYFRGRREEALILVQERAAPMKQWLEMEIGITV